MNQIKVGEIIGLDNFFKIEILSLDPVIGKVVSAPSRMNHFQIKIGQELLFEKYKSPEELADPSLEIKHPYGDAWVFREDYSNWIALHGEYMGGWILYPDKNGAYVFTHTCP